MSIQNIYNFLSHPQNSCSSFSQLTSVTENANNVQGVLRHNDLEHFIKAIPLAIEALQQNHTQVDASDWKKFERSFSALVKPFKDQEGLLEKISKIELLCQRQFTKLDPKLFPITLKGPQGQEAIVSRASLKSEVFQKMLSGSFAESQKHEINFSYLTPASFDSVATFLTNKDVEIPQKQIQEILSFAHVHALPGLFLKALNALEIVPCRKIFEHDETPLDPICRDACDSLFALLGDPHYDDISDFEKLSLDSKTEKISQKGQDPFVSQLLLEDVKIQSDFCTALYNFGLRFDQGSGGVNKDRKKAVALYTWGATRGIASSQFALGDFYKNGINGFTKDPAEALEWYKKAALNGYVEAQYLVGCICINGDVDSDKFSYTPEEFKKALKWFRKAAENGHPKAQCLLADEYESKGNLAEAAKWYKLAAENGHPKAQWWVASEYEVKGNFTEAAKWYQLASEQGNGHASATLARYYEEGRGVQQNFMQSLILDIKAYNSLVHEIDFNEARVYYQHALAKISLLQEVIGKSRFDEMISSLANSVND